MAKFFGVSLFKKASSGHSADSPKMKKDFGALSVRERTKNISNAPTVMWDAICDLNSSSDLDDSTDFFYSRSGIFSPQPEKPSSPIQSASEKPQKPVSSSSTNKWKTNFLVPEISPRHPRTTETTPISPSISRFQSKSRASPSMGFRYSSTLGRSPAFKSNSSTAELEVTEHDIPSDTDTTNSPKVTHVITDIEKNGLNSVESRTSLDLSTISLDQTNEEGNQDSNYQCRSMGEMNNVQRQSAHEEGQCREVEACDSDGYDKLAILHVKLKNEAVKLENWKNEMIAKLNKNEEKLAEANTLVASLRKSNLELQMDRENASLKVKDEVEKREAIEKKWFIYCNLMYLCHRIIGTRDLCEAIKTQIEFVQSTCTSTMQTCFKTATTQKVLEALLENTFKDFQNLSIQLDESRAKNRKQLNEKHNHDKNTLSTRNSELTAVLEKLVSEREEISLISKKCAETLKNQILKIRTTLESMDLFLEVGSQMKFGLEKEIESVNIELLNVKASKREKEGQLSEALFKCSQLSDDLSRVYTLLQNSENNCLKRGQKITSMEGEIKKLTEEKRFLQDDLHKKSMIHEADVRSGQKELLLLTEKLNMAILTLNALVHEKDELLKLLEQERMNLLFSSSKSIEDLRCAKTKGNELLLHIEEQERITAEKDRLITTLKNTKDGYFKEVETLRCELNKSEEKYKDLEESLSNEKRLRAEAEEKLVCLQENEKIRNKEILDLRNLTSNQQNEIEDLTTKVRNIEFDQNNLNSRNQDMSRCIELKNDQIVRLEERLHEAEQRVLVLENAAARAGQEVRTSSSSLAQRDAEVSQLREALHTAQAEHATALRHCEEVRAELLGAVEQQQQESDKVLRQKEKEIGSLKEMLNALQKEADKSSKRIEKKLTDNVVHMEKLNDQLKETVQEKKELSKQLTASKQKMTKLEKDADEKKVLLSEMEEKVGNLDAELTNLNNEKAKLTAALSTKDAEIERLRYIEAEFADFKRSIMNNSPPCSTQIPKSIEIEVQKTPRSPLLSEKLNRMVLLKTPQKTPKSILKQPGSECKRRRVLLISPEKSTPKSGCFEVEPELEVELQAGSKTVDTNSETCLVVAQPCFKPAPPRTPNIRGTPQTRNANIRKTPSSGSRGRGPPTNTRSSMRLGSAKGPTATTNAAHVTTSVAASSWFDSDETFGLNTEE
ncbi:hypothetical protein ECG_09648 [Echinococcus granulosus]|uniref:Girdin-like n=1 Tax=Echinococcus granulosus TaxID=6210 RepID=A0A068WL25_ECHGR|nr:hypothetical protein ECG_09648 [Echinococcus granulosus]CDS20491.1 hypothetical protein EgrG_001116500 [Echinococcus granulosus]